MTTTTWLVDGILNGNATTGTITGTGNNVTYHAPSTAGSHEITVTANIEVNQNTPLSLSLVANLIENITLNLTSGTCYTNGQAFFSAEVFASGNADKTVTWSVDNIKDGNSSVGTIISDDNMAVYTAPPAVGLHTITATSTFDPTKSVSCPLTIIPNSTTNNVTSLTMNPTAITLAQGATSPPIVATVSVTGNTPTDVSWTATGGTINGTGNSVTFTAGNTPGSFLITAISVADHTKSAYCQVNVLPSVTSSVTSIALDNKTLNVAQNAITNLTATVVVTGNAAQTVTWSVLKGKITGTGNTITYTAPASAGSDTITATSIADITKSASCAVTIAAASGVTIALSNTTSIAGLNNTLNPNGTALVSAIVSGNANTAVAWTVDGIVNGNALVGTINPGVFMGGTNNQGNTVLYTAPATPGTHIIAATSIVGGSTASFTMTIAAQAYNIANSTVINVPAPTGNGTTDRNNIRAALKPGIVNFQPGTYVVNADSNYNIFDVPSNCTLVFPAGCTVKQGSSPSGGQCGIFAISNQSNINFVGPGTIDGNNQSIGGSNTSNIEMNSGSNICVANMKLINASFDGITMEGIYGNANLTKVLVYGCTITASERNGMSPCGIDYSVIRDCTMTGAKNNPAAGIDFEPNPTQRATYGYVFNCNLSNNVGGDGYGAGISSGPGDSNTSTASMNNMTFAFNTVDGNKAYGIEAQHCPNVRILNNHITNTKAGSGAAIVYKGNGILLRGTDATVIVMGNSLSGNAASGIGLDGAQVTQAYNTLS